MLCIAVKEDEAIELVVDGLTTIRISQARFPGMRLAFEMPPSVELRRRNLTTGELVPFKQRAERSVPKAAPIARVTDAMARVILNLADGVPADNHCVDRGQVAGFNVTINALLKNGIVAFGRVTKYELTSAGEAVAAELKARAA